MFVVILLTCFLIILIYLYECKQKCSDRWKKISKFPGDSTLPLLGNSLQLGFNADDATEKLLDAWRRHGKQNFRLTVGSVDWILLTEPDDIGTLLNHTVEISKTLERNAAMEPFFGNSVSSMEGENWRSMRKLMTSCFHFNNLEKRLENVNKSSDRLLAIFNNYEDNGSVDVYRYLTPFIYDLVCETLMGVESDLLANPDHPYLQASSKTINIITQNFFSYWRNIRTLFMLTPGYREMKETVKILRQNSAHLIAERRKILNQLITEDIKHEGFILKSLYEDGCLLDKLLLGELKNGESFPDKLINDEVTLMCFTGHFTSTKTISHTLYCLAKYPEIQRKVIEEFRAIFKDDFNKKPTNNELNKMKYLEAVIKETIRVIPILGTIGRRLQNDLKFKDGRVVPAGTSVFVFYNGLYQNPKVFPEPEKYKPERHLQPMHTFSLVPFSAGPRNCIGFRYAWILMKATLSNILRRYEIIPGGPGTEPQFAYRIITESKNGIQLRFKKRNN